MARGMGPAPKGSGGKISRKSPARTSERLARHQVRNNAEQNGAKRRKIAGHEQKQNSQFIGEAESEVIARRSKIEDGLRSTDDEEADEAGPEPEPIPSIKDLASSYPATRRNALQTIKTHLSNRRTLLTANDALALSHGFYVQLWMHDSKNALSVQSLTEDLAKLVVPEPQENTSASRVQEKNSVQMTSTFWETICREWLSIDQHRMNKYLYFVRLVLRRSLIAILSSTLADKDGDAGVHHELVEILAKWPLSPRERKVPDGVRLHVIDCFVDEMEKALEPYNVDDEDADLQTTQQLLQRAVTMMLKPLEGVAKDGLAKVVRTKAKEALADERIEGWRAGVYDEDGSGDGEEVGDAEEDGRGSFEGFKSDGDEHENDSRSDDDKLGDTSNEHGGFHGPG